MTTETLALLEATEARLLEFEAPSLGPVGAGTCAASDEGPRDFFDLPWACPSAADAKIMLVDDEPMNIEVWRTHLEDAGYRNFLEIDDAAAALGAARLHRPDAILLDVMMPGISGLHLLRQLRLDPELRTIPVVIISAADDGCNKLAALEHGAFDFLAKPVHPAELILRVRNVLACKLQWDALRGRARSLEDRVRERTRELEKSRQELIYCLARAAEFRDNETGEHVRRVGIYSGAIARRLGLDEARCQLIEQAAPLHDMGKLGVPDAVLLKPGCLDEDEMEIMRRHSGWGKKVFEPIVGPDRLCFRSHTYVGESIFDAGSSPLLQTAARIALTHHERWDGRGYPLGLVGTEIPLEGRIVSVADVFDALSSRRPYKPAFPLEKCYAILSEGRGTQFDPAVLDAFFELKDEIVAIRLACADVD